MYGKDNPGSGADIGFFMTTNASLKVSAIFYSGTTSSGLGGRTTLSINTWYYIKWYRSNGTSYLYVNNNFEGASPTTSFINAPGMGWTLKYGQYSTPQPLQFGGYLDDWRITKGYARIGPTMPTAPFPNQ